MKNDENDKIKAAFDSLIQNLAKEAKDFTEALEEKIKAEQQQNIPTKDRTNPMQRPTFSKETIEAFQKDIKDIDQKLIADYAKTALEGEHGNEVRQFLSQYNKDLYKEILRGQPQEAFGLDIILMQALEAESKLLVPEITAFLEVAIEKIDSNDPLKKIVEIWIDTKCNHEQAKPKMLAYCNELYSTNKTKYDAVVQGFEGVGYTGSQKGGVYLIEQNELPSEARKTALKNAIICIDSLVLAKRQTGNPNFSDNEINDVGKTLQNILRPFEPEFSQQNTKYEAACRDFAIKKIEQK